MKVSLQMPFAMPLHDEHPTDRGTRPAASLCTHSTAHVHIPPSDHASPNYGDLANATKAWRHMPRTSHSISNVFNASNGAMSVAVVCWTEEECCLWCLSELLGFWTFSIDRYSKHWKTRRFGSWVYFLPQVMGGDTYSNGSLTKT
jgi:hypothetical protein